jgi:hypothetical protein
MHAHHKLKLQRHLSISVHFRWNRLLCFEISPGFFVGTPSITYSGSVLLSVLLPRISMREFSPFGDRFFQYKGPQHVPAGPASGCPRKRFLQASCLQQLQPLRGQPFSAFGNLLPLPGSDPLHSRLM